MLLPGPEAQQLVAYIGWKLRGIKGGLIAGLLFFVPSMFILLILSIVYVTFGNLPWVVAVFSGIKPAVVAFVFLSFFKIAQKTLKNRTYYIIAGLAFLRCYLQLIKSKFFSSQSQINIFGKM